MLCECGSQHGEMRDDAGVCLCDDCYDEFCMDCAQKWGSDEPGQANQDRK